MYKTLNEHTVLRIADNVCIPLCVGNRDYEEYKAWLAEGNAPEQAMTDIETAEQGKQSQIAEAKAYLANTDWIVTKISEAQIQGRDIASMIEKYSATLTEREAARALINIL